MNVPLPVWIGNIYSSNLTAHESTVVLLKISASAADVVDTISKYSALLNKFLGIYILLIQSTIN